MIIASATSSRHAKALSDRVVEDLKSNNSDLTKVFNNLLELIKIRKKQKAFHPNATQYTLSLGKRFFGLWRQSNDKQQSIFAISNISNMTVYLDLTILNLINTENLSGLKTSN